MPADPAFQDSQDPLHAAASSAGPSLRQRLADCRLCVLLEAQPSPEAFDQLLGSLLEAGVPLIQLRDKSASDAVMLDRGRRAMALAHRIDGRSPAIVLINDRVAVAAAAGVDGVHLGAADLPVAEARRILGPGRLIGRTAHDLAEACAAQAAGADCLGIGPCYPSATKSFAEQAPRDFLRDTAAGIPLPLFAIGGITPERLPELAALGIHRVAVAAAVTAAPDPAAAAREFLAALALATRPPDHEPSSSARRLSQETGRQGTTAANDSGNPLGPA